MTLLRSSNANLGGGGSCPARAPRSRAGVAARANPPFRLSSRKRRRGMSSTEKNLFVMAFPLGSLALSPRQVQHPEKSAGEQGRHLIGRILGLERLGDDVEHLVLAGRLPEAVLVDDGEIVGPHGLPRLVDLLDERGRVPVL